jgi:hypothetical protein
LKNDLHPPALRLVREQVPDQATGHLVELLVRRVPVVDAVADVPNVANGDGLDASLMERRDKPGGLFVHDVPDLVIQAAQLPPQGPDHASVTT